MRAAGGAENYASELEIPSHFLITGPPPKLVPLRGLNLKDAVKNFVLYVPLGFLLGFLIAVRRGGRHGCAAFAALLVIAAISMSLEALQYLLVPDRWPSIDDVIFNTLGGGLGLLLTVWAKQLRISLVHR
jgi:glycopeptide antibiotics resistance protein